MKKIAIATILATAAIAASAQNQTYVTVGYSQVSVDDQELQRTATPGMISLTLGKELNKNLAVEGQLGVGTGYSSFISGPGGHADAKVDSTFGVFLKPKVEVASGVEFYGKVGVNRMKGTEALTLGGSTISASDTKTGIAYGVGASFTVAKNDAVGVDYMKYPTFNDGGPKVDAVTVSYKHGF